MPMAVEGHGETFGTKNEGMNHKVLNINILPPVSGGNFIQTLYHALSWGTYRCLAVAHVFYNKHIIINN